MNDEEKKGIIDIFSKYAEVKLAYLFGSRARNENGPMSDYDFAIYLDNRDQKNIFNIKARLLDELSRFLKTDKIDLVILDTADQSELKYDIIKDGQLLFEQEPYKVIVEPAILNEYFDFRENLIRHGLTKAYDKVS